MNFEQLRQCTRTNCFGGAHGETPEISEYLNFSFYYWCCYNDNAGLGETKLGWLTENDAQLTFKAPC